MRTDHDPKSRRCLRSGAQSDLLASPHTKGAVYALFDSSPFNLDRLPVAHLAGCRTDNDGRGTSAHRRDGDIIRQATIIGDFFHEIYIYEDQCTRGRPDGEVMLLMREGFAQGAGSTRRDRVILQESGELAAIGAAISSLKPGDLLLCQVDQIELALDYVMGICKPSEPHATIGSPAEKHKAPAAAVPATAS